MAESIEKAASSVNRLCLSTSRAESHSKDAQRKMLILVGCAVSR